MAQIVQDGDAYQEQPAEQIFPDKAKKDKKDKRGRLKPVTEQQMKDFVENNDLSTAQKIELQLNRMARNFDMITLLIFGLSTAVLGYMLGRNEVVMAIFLILFSAFLWFASWIMPKGTMGSKILQAILKNRLGEQIINTFTGKQNDK